jgi:hypothetical protein
MIEWTLDKTSIIQTMYGRSFRGIIYLRRRMMMRTTRTRTTTTASRTVRMTTTAMLTTNKAKMPHLLTS